MRLGLEQLLIEGNDAPISLIHVHEYRTFYLDNPTRDREPIEVEWKGVVPQREETFTPLHVYVIRNGRHRFIAAMLAGRKDILAEEVKHGTDRG